MNLDVHVVSLTVRDTCQVVVVLLNTAPFFQVLLSAWFLELYPVVFILSSCQWIFGFVVSFLVIHTHLW